MPVSVPRLVAEHAVAARHASEPTGPDDRSIITATEALSRDVVLLLPGR